MQEITDHEFKMVQNYRKTKDESIPLYFFNKFHQEIADIVFYKINDKFSSIPFEKGDLFHLIWNSLIKTLNECKEKKDFNGVLINNTYFMTLREVRKFLNNGELVMNVSSSLERYESKPKGHIDYHSASYIEKSRKAALNDLIENACEHIQDYTQNTIKNVLYLKSIGYSVREISEELKISRHHVKNLLDNIEKMIRKLYF